jgi:hypothetical protein
LSPALVKIQHDALTHLFLPFARLAQSCWLSLKTDPPFAFKIDPPSVGDYT